MQDTRYLAGCYSAKTELGTQGSIGEIYLFMGDSLALKTHCPGSAACVWNRSCASCIVNIKNLRAELVVLRFQDLNGRVL